MMIDVYVEGSGDLKNIDRQEVEVDVAVYCVQVQVRRYAPQL